jgi:hypothetical protein
MRLGRVGIRATARAAGAGALLALACAVPAAAQRDTVVVAGPQYRAGGLRTLLLGENYREAWATPVRVPVLNPDTFAGGLTVLQEGGGFSTESLRMQGRDGREYTFRSVDKSVKKSLAPELQNSVAEWVTQDLVSAKHPAAAVVAPALLDAVGVLHATARLYVMPNHPFLGEHRADFAGRLGQVEVRPTDGGGKAPPFAGARDVEGSEDFRKRIEEEPDHVVDAAGFLTARLMDVYLGDWDRHWDQWRWARFDSAGLKVWKPIPRDRDNALSDNGGLIPTLGRTVAPMLTDFSPEYHEVLGLVRHASELDRLLLPGLSRRDWDSVATFVRSRLTDRVIDEAVHRLPPEYYAQDGERLASYLKSRRDLLPRAAAEYYEILAGEVDLHATDERDVAAITRRADGSVHVRVTLTEKDGGRSIVRFDRVFVPDETRDVRVYLHGGDDRATVTGRADESLMVRVIGGGGDDELVDESAAGGGRRTVFYDDRGDNRFVTGGEAKVDTREYVAGTSEALVRNAPPPRDWGSSFSLTTPFAAWPPNIGPVLGFGPTWTRWGFRRRPYASMVALRALWAPWESGYGADLLADFRHTNRPSRVGVHARASNFEVVRFHGYGNDTPEDPDRDAFEVDQTQVRGDIAYYVRPTPKLELYLGPSAKWTDPDAGLAFSPDPLLRGTDRFTQYGAIGGGWLDLRDSAAYPRNGAFFRVDARGYGSDVGTFAHVLGEASGYASLLGRPGPTLAAKAGARKALGDFPFQEAAWIGGPGTVRGYGWQRFTGDAAVYGSAEVRQRLGRVNLVLARPIVGVYALGDAGRVYVDGDSPGGWHTGYGGGLSFEVLNRSLAVSVAHGESTTVYVHFGMPF